MKRFLALVSLALATACAEKPQPAPNLPKVKVTAVISDTVRIEKDFVGEVLGQNDIPIRARVEGFLEKIHFQEGEPVKKGQLLYTIDPQPFEADLAVAESQLAEAQIASIRAGNDLKRMEPLAEMKAVSERDYDASKAEKEASEEMVSAAKANARMKEIRLGYTKIESPINGLIGRSLAREGEFVGRSPNPVILNTVSEIDSIRVQFFITENDYLRLARFDTTQQGAKRALKLILSDGTIFGQPGYLDFVDRQVDAATGAILLQATFANPKRLIRPGQFARIRAVTRQENEGILVPQRSVSEFQGRFRVMVVNDSNKVEQRPVQIVAPYRDYYLIGDGVKPGEKVILEGLQKVREGAPVAAEEVKFDSKYPGAQ